MISSEYPAMTTRSSIDVIDAPGHCLCLQARLHLTGMQRKMGENSGQTVTREPLVF